MAIRKRHRPRAEEDESEDFGGIFFFFLFVLRLCGCRCFGEIWNLIVGVWYGNQICIKSIMRAADTFMMSLIFIKYYKVVV